ncbi:MAG: hypothetical protein J6T10_19695 [Methanobrevibacter sp.]|nr:hypothetical protein [Methanobrevibacter sp.]
MNKKIKDLTQNEMAHICSNHFSSISRMLHRKCSTCPLFNICDRKLTNKELNTKVDLEIGKYTVRL